MANKIKKKLELVVFLIILTWLMPLIVAANYLAPFTQRGNADVAIISSQDPIITETEENLEIEGSLWTKKQICLFTKGCFDKEGLDCYPMGYIKDKQYCGIYYIASFEKFDFINQSLNGEACSYNFECKSNFCFNGECIGSFQAMLKDVLLRISNLEEKGGLIKGRVNALSQEKEVELGFEEISLKKDLETKENVNDFLKIFENLLSKNE